MPFAGFWEFLKDHANCILGASWGSAALFDEDALHWAVFDQEDHHAVLQLIRGKNLVGELVLDSRQVDEVELGPDPENPQSGHFLAELLSSARAGREVLGHVLMAHGPEEAQRHPVLRH
jgi:hypothetical protein